MDDIYTRMYFWKKKRHIHYFFTPPTSRWRLESFLHSLLYNLVDALTLRKKRYRKRFYEMWTSYQPLYGFVESIFISNEWGANFYYTKIIVNWALVFILFYFIFFKPKNHKMEEHSTPKGVNGEGSMNE